MAVTSATTPARPFLMSSVMSVLSDLEVEDAGVEVVVRLVVDEVIQICPVLHLAELRSQMPFIQKGIQRTSCCAHGDAQQRHRPDDDVHTDVPQLVDA